MKRKLAFSVFCVLLLTACEGATTKVAKDAKPTLIGTGTGIHIQRRAVAEHKNFPRALKAIEGITDPKERADVLKLAFAMQPHDVLAQDTSDAVGIEVSGNLNPLSEDGGKITWKTTDRRIPPQLFEMAPIIWNVFFETLQSISQDENATKQSMLAAIQGLLGPLFQNLGLLMGGGTSAPSTLQRLVPSPAPTSSVESESLPTPVPND